MMSDTELRRLCNIFFDAYQDQRVDVLEQLYAPDCIVWHNCFRRETTGAENLEKLPASYDGQRRRTYNDRRIDTFDDGFVVRYMLNGVHHDGFRGALSVCIVARCRAGKITRIDEYIDTGKFPEWRGEVPADDLDDTTGTGDSA